MYKIIIDSVIIFETENQVLYLKLHLKSVQIIHIALINNFSFKR